MRLGSDSELFGIAPTAGREARHGKPAQGEVRGYLGELSGAYGLPVALVQALAQTESNFDTGHTRAKRGATHDDFEPENTGYGVMQVRDDQIGQTVPAPDGSAHKIGSDIKTNWRANARAGVALLAQQYQLATLESPFGSEQEHAPPPPPPPNRRTRAIAVARRTGIATCKGFPIAINLPIPTTGAF